MTEWSVRPDTNHIDDGPRPRERARLRRCRPPSRRRPGGWPGERAPAAAGAASGAGRSSRPRRRTTREVIEAALAHGVLNKVEAAYARSDLFERLLLLMDDWGEYLGAHANRPPPANQTEQGVAETAAP